MKQLLFLLLFPCLALAQYQGNANQKITLGEQTTADGLVYRGVASIDTVTATSKITRANKQDTSAYILLDTVTNLLWHYKIGSNRWIQAGGSTLDTATMLLPYYRAGRNTIIQAVDVPTLNQNTTGSAATLTTGRTIQTNLASTSSASFNGSANITPGVTGVLPVANGGTGSTIGSITGSDSLHFQAGGTNKNVRITPSTTGDIILNGDVSIGNRPAQERLSVGLNTNVEVGFGLESGGKGYLGTYSPPTYTYDGIVLSINRRPTNGVFANTGFSHAEIAIVAANADSYIGFFTGQTNNVIGIERMRIDKSGNVGIGTTGPAVQFHTTGGVRFAGLASITDLRTDVSGNLFNGSDFNLKNSIDTINFGLSDVLKLKPVSFNWNDEQRNINEYKSMGFIAQDVMNIIPNATSTMGDGDMQVDYNAIVATLTKAIQEQQALIKALEQRILTLENK